MHRNLYLNCMKWYLGTIQNTKKKKKLYLKISIVRLDST